VSGKNKSEARGQRIAASAGKAFSGNLAFFLLLLLAGIYGCSAQGKQETPAPKEASRPPVAVEVITARAADVMEGIDVVGSLASKFGADVKSEYTGIVAEVFVTEWVKVKKGDPLARLDTRENDNLVQKTRAALEVAKASLLQADVAASRAGREYERALKLKEAGLVTQQNLDDSRTEKEAAAARIEAAKAQLKVAEEDIQQAKTRLSKSMIRCPIDGRVYLRNVNVGDFVGEMGAKPMFRIIDPRILDLTVSVPSGDMAAVRVGQAITFTTDALPEKVFTGKVMFINPTVNETDRSVKVVAEVDNSEEILTSGLFVKGRILTGKRSNVIRIARSALLTWDIPGKKAEAFIVEGDVARRRALRTGNVSGDEVEISAGLAAGQQVVTRGGFNLRDGYKVIATRAGGEK
jgi:membrane fusion protein, multidrug efflux system